MIAEAGKNEEVDKDAMVLVMTTAMKRQGGWGTHVSKCLSFEGSLSPACSPDRA